MHNAPAVSYPAGRSPLAGLAMLGAWLAAAGGLALWSAQSRTVPAGFALAAAAIVATGAFALHAWRRSPCGTLSWDGNGWVWTANAGAQAGTPELALDAQQLLLLRWHGDGRDRWLWLERSAQPARWDDVRRAVYSRASPP